MFYILDRFEGDLAVCECENRTMINIDRNKLPQNIKEGDCFSLVNGVYIIDINRTNSLRNENIELLNKLKSK